MDSASAAVWTFKDQRSSSISDCQQKTLTSPGGQQMAFDTTAKSFRKSSFWCFVSSTEPGPFPGIVDVFGAGGGLLEYRASLLAGKGFAVMALAYYNYDDLPKSMESLHLEYFEEAVNCLLSHPQVGTSLGSVLEYPVQVCV